MNRISLLVLLILIGVYPQRALGVYVLLVKTTDSLARGTGAQWKTQTAPLPVVPGGEGFGMTTRAAYGGDTPPAILRVTTLADAGPGSLRAALLTTGPRVIIFETSGTIMLASDIVVTEPYV